MKALGLLTISFILAAHTYAASPIVGLTSPGPQTVPLGTTVTVSGWASDPDGNMIEHWLEVKRPAGDWSWEGWLTYEPFGGALNGDGSYSSKSGTLTLTDVGTYTFRVTANDGVDPWAISNEVQVTVTPAPSYGYISTTASIYLTSGGAPNATGAHYSINDNGIVVSGATTYVQNQPPDTTTTFNLRHAAAGPGYVVWTVWENHGTQAGFMYTIVHNMLARYIRATRSWTVTEVKQYREGGIYTGYYSFADIVPGSMTAQQYQWAAQLQTWRIGGSGGDAWMEYGTYAIPMQQL